MSPHAFDVSTGLERLEEDRFRADIDAGWFAPLGPNGGYLATVLLRALTVAVDDEERAPRSLNVHYLRPPQAGAAEVSVSVERVGRSLSTLSARLEQDGRLCCLALAAFSREMTSAAEWSPAMPKARPLEEIERLEAPEGAPELFARLDVRPAIGARPFSGAEEARTGAWLSFDPPRPIDALACATLVDAYWPAPFTRLSGPIAAPTIDLSIHFRCRLPVGEPAPVLGLYTSRASAEGFFEEDAELWSPNGVLLAQGRQLALARPL